MSNPGIIRISWLTLSGVIRMTTNPSNPSAADLNVTSTKTVNVLDAMLPVSIYTRITVPKVNCCARYVIQSSLRKKTATHH